MKPESKDIEINGVRLSTTKLPPTRAYVLSPKLMRIVAPALGAVLSAGIGAESVEDLQNSVMNTNDLAEGLMKFSDAERMQLMLDVFASTTARIGDLVEELTSEKMINAAFPDFTTLLRALWWVIGFNFFPSGVAELVAAARAKAKAAQNLST